jgi:crossover junction endodeoxyribonuclease RusA
VERSFEISLPPGTPLLNSNNRLHWSKKARITKNLRWTAFLLAKGAKIPHLDTVKILVRYHAPDNRRRDAHNFAPAVKACLDGIVDSGALKDDSDRYVKSLEIARASENIRGGQLVITIIEVGD